ncbi:MAG TPA: N-acetylmuramoyl-L-alanine amidase, partial [Firmicutes bacterium]|nr:N-acetylmuramoyl-L-alanine amidase [Bacillota bacterium]
WEEQDVDLVKNIVVKVNNESYTLEPTETSFVFETTDPNTKFNVGVTVNKKGFGFANKSKKTITTSSDNATLYQEVSDLVINNTEVSFTHHIQKDSEGTLDLSSLSYDVMTQYNEILSTIVPTDVEETNDLVSIKVTVPLQLIQDQYAILFGINYEKNGVSYKNAVKDFDITTSDSSSYAASPFEVVFQNQMLVLLNLNTEYYLYESHNFYAESLHVTVDTEEEIETYQLILNDEVKYDLPYLTEGNNGIILKDLAEGHYLIQYDGKPIYTTDTIYDVWYTIYREGVAKQITIETYMGMLSVEVKDVTQTPDDVYDILIDPGHGGLDGGTEKDGVTEAEEVLKVATYIASRLEEHGLKVKLTRDDEFDPSGEGNFDYTLSPYKEEGRVEQVYRYSANYMISNHLNAFDGSLSGFEVYSSIMSTNDWASSIANEFEAIGHEARDSIKNEYRVSTGSYKSYTQCVAGEYLPNGCSSPYIDYLYIIRETGGQFSQSTSLVKYNENYEQIPNHGAETVLVEYVYLDNATDNAAWIQNWQAYGEAIVKATVAYLDIPYQK